MEENKTPVHVAVIMDGNGRWAKSRRLPRSAGHKAGMNRMISLAEHAGKIGIRYLTVYALSTENLSRPKSELDGLFSLFRKYFKSSVNKLYQNNSAVKVIGDLSALPEDIEKLLRDGEARSPRDAEFTVVFAINYGGRAELVRAAKLAAERGADLNEQTLSSFLYTGGVPDPDLLIRTGGELRLSNFLLYQSAYAELYFTDVLFPDFDEKEFDKALSEYARRERRFGRTPVEDCRNDNKK